jgi:murein DD-endopeptidase MepM/ murein hydrolase activator NlpD
MADPVIPFGTFTNARYALRDDAKPADDGRWFWPLPRLAGEQPQIISYANDDRLGVDIGYRQLAFGDLFVPVFAARGGTISYAAQVTSGFALTIDHGGMWSTHYAHLEQMFVTPTLGRRRRRARVQAGDVIGYAGRTPNHVRFELWRWTRRDGFVPVRSSLFMREWLTLPQFEPSAASVAQHVALRASAPNIDHTLSA